MQTKNEITPSTRRLANGCWQATLEFPNGGIQAFRSLYHSHNKALEAAKGLLKSRPTRPNGCVFDPAPYVLVVI